MRLHFTDNEVKIMEQCLKKWGLQTQIGQAVEECAELIAVLQKYTYSSGNDCDVEKILDEIADVEMMLGQMRLCLGISDETLRRRVSEKFARLSHYLENDMV